MNLFKQYSGFVYQAPGCCAMHFRYESIPKVVSACMDAHLKGDFTKTPKLEDIIAVDEWARDFVRKWEP